MSMYRLLLIFTVITFPSCAFMKRNFSDLSEKGINKTIDLKTHPDYPKGGLASIPRHTVKYEPKTKYGNPPYYTVFGKRYYVLKTRKGYDKVGIASWYGLKYHGKRTSSGEPYNMFSYSAAHPHLPLPTYLLVRNLENGREIIVRANDRGPFTKGRLIDLSYAAAKKLSFQHKGTAKVRITALTPDKKKK